MFISVLARRLKPGKTYEDFVEAWYPDQGFNVSGRGPILARSVIDDKEILALAFVDLPGTADLDETMRRIATQEAVRHDRIAAVIESTTLRGVYEITDEFDFSTDETVAAGRPASLKR
jgi:hypothetical protein